MSHQSKSTLQPSTAQVGCRARRARRWPVGGEAGQSAHVEGDAVAGQDDGDDVGVAGERRSWAAVSWVPSSSSQTPLTRSWSQRTDISVMARMVGRALCLVMTSAPRERRAISAKASAHVWAEVRRCSGGILALRRPVASRRRRRGWRRGRWRRSLRRGRGWCVEAVRVLGDGGPLTWLASALVGGSRERCGPRRGPGPSVRSVPGSRLRAARSAQGRAQLVVVEDRVAVGGVGVLGEDAGVVEGDPSAAEGGADGRQDQQLAGDLGSGVGVDRAHAGGGAHEGLGVPEGAHARGPPGLDLDGELGVFGIQPRPVGLQLPSPAA